MIGPLPSPRHELFAQAVASGMSASKSYALAYSRPRNGATSASAARLLTNRLSFQLSTSLPELLSRRVD
jgi:hypothetical protein